MRERDRTHNRKKTKLTKPTTFITSLLIVVTLILSSAVTATTMKMNENKEEIITNDPIVMAIGEDTGGAALPDMNTVLEKENPYEGAYRGVVVYDNGMSYTGLAASHICSVYDALSADDFYFTSDT
jgi:hypothetical protein